MTAKERNLLLFILIIVASIAYYFFLYTPKQAERHMLENDIASLEAKSTELQIKYVDKNRLLDEIKEFKSTINIEQANYPSGINNEMQIYVMNDIETKIKSLELTSYTFAGEEILFSKGEYVKEGENVPSYRYALVNQPINYSIDVTYEDLKSFLALIANYSQRLGLDNISMIEDAESGKINVVLQMNMFAIERYDEAFITKNYFGAYEKGKERVIGTGAINTGNGVNEDKLYTRDMYISLAPITADITTIIIGRKVGAGFGSYVYDDANNDVPVELVFKQIDDTYYIEYKTSKDKFPEETTEVVFEPGNAIDIDVYSYPRVGTQDFSGANVTIRNTTDLPVHVHTLREDENRPRFKVIEYIGESAINYFK